MMAKLKVLPQTVTSSAARFWIFVGFSVLVFLTGGGSRYDIQSLVLLRPFAIIFAAYALFLFRKDDFGNVRMPLILLVMLILLCVAQLVPLPATIWSKFAGREAIFELSQMLNRELGWRSLSLSPSRTLNSLFSLAVPTSVILLFAIQSNASRLKLLPILIVICLVGALLSVLQVIGGVNNPLYLYRISNFDSPVGFFANRNHHSVQLGILIVMISAYLTSLDASHAANRLKMTISAAAIVVLIPLIFITGSRTGLVIGAIALSAAGYFVYAFKNTGSGSNSVISIQNFRSGFLVIGFLVAAVLIILGTIYFGRDSALERLVFKEDMAGLRGDILPVLVNMAKQYFWSGSGFGSFEMVYKMSEPEEMLTYRYLNQAHNDWLQWIIEGGVFVFLLVAIYLVWFVVTAIKFLRRRKKYSYRLQRLGLMSIICIVMIGLASVTDYPLRTPIFMGLFAIFNCFLAWLTDLRSSKNFKLD